MKKALSKLFLVISVFVLILFSAILIPNIVLAEEKNEDEIIILYENDVHSAVEGYSKLSALKKELKETYEHVGVVSSGDYIQGGNLAAISKGEYIVNLMNLVGYDAVTLGNHEFDYELVQLKYLVDLMNTKPVTCNFEKIGSTEQLFKPYEMVSYGDIDIAYIGITTPETMSSSSPKQFKNEQGEYIYTFHATDLASVIQKTIDEVLSAGAEYVVALSHYGYDETGQIDDVTDLIKELSGLDVVLDAHSHSIIESMKVEDKDGQEVLLTSTGTKFEHIGKLTISSNEIKSELIKTAEYEKTDSTIDEYLDKINAEFNEKAQEVIGSTEVDLIATSEDGNRIVRTQETNLGNLCADAYRHIGGATIGIVNGGGVRKNIQKGEITFSEALEVFPFGNTLVVVEVSGQVIKDAIEMSISKYPAENGGFLQVSGLRYKINGSIPSSVVKDENGNFVYVKGTYRAYDIEVLNPETNEYEVLNLEKTYTVASHNFMLLSCGDGMTMFEGAKVIRNDGFLDMEVLMNYIKELKVIDEERYGNIDGRITFTEGFNKAHKVTYVLDGKVVKEMYVEDGKDAIAPELPSKDGYSASWNHDGKQIKDDLIITAIYSKDINDSETNNPLRIAYIVLIIGAGVCITYFLVRKNKTENKKLEEN